MTPPPSGASPAAPTHLPSTAEKGALAPEGTDGWLGRLWHRLTIVWPAKGLGTTAFMFLFFWAYFWVQENLDSPATVMPEIWLDRWVGFVPWSFSVYLSLWLYVFLVPAVLGSLRALVWFGVWVGAMCLLCLAIFWWFPTRTPTVTIDWSLYPGLALIKGVDGSGNACPSLHVASAVFSCCWLHRIIDRMRAPVVLQWLSVLQCVAIVWSTMATLQHVALDVFAGASVGLLFAAASLRHVRRDL
jgi:PAP2 superfamily